jgi:hypothetical protein
VGGLFLSELSPASAHGNTASFLTCIEIRKGETSMPEKNETTSVAAKAAGLGISLDAWAVALALGLALLVWAGVIKRVPW